MKRFLLIVVASFLLVGCATKPEIRYITKTETLTVVLDPPKSLYSPVKHIKPMSISGYVNASWDDKERMLYDYISKLDTQIDSLMIDRASVGLWVTEQNKNIENSKKEVKK